MDASDGRLSADVRGEVEVEDGVLILRRIRVRYRLQAEESRRSLIERVHRVHARHCPVYRSLEAAIEITTELEIVAPEEGAGGGGRSGSSGG